MVYLVDKAHLDLVVVMVNQVYQVLQVRHHKANSSNKISFSIQVNQVSLEKMVVQVLQQIQVLKDYQ